MTVVTPGGPCLTQTQITRNENQERFQKQQEAKKAAQPNPIDASTQTAGKITDVEKTEKNPQYPQSYGAPGVHIADIIA